MILHIISSDKFTSEYVKFINQNFEQKEHLFLVMSFSGQNNFVEGILHLENVVIIEKNFKSLIALCKSLIKSEKVILHGLFSNILMMVLNALNVAKKCYWCVWGGDLYSFYTESQRVRKLKRSVIRKLKGLITPIKGDYLLAQQLYGATGEWFSCFLYLSNIVRENPVSTTKSQGEQVHILLGNSGDSSNNHLEILEKLKENENVNLVLPLSYGSNDDKDYISKVKEYAQKEYGKRAIILDKFIPLEEYLAILNEVDIAVFNHNRQQGVGNIVSLLSYGKKVYIREEVTTFETLKSMGLHIYKTEELESTLSFPMSEEERKRNIEIVTNTFSYDNLIKEWKSVFDA